MRSLPQNRPLGHGFSASQPDERTLKRKLSRAIGEEIDDDEADDGIVMRDATVMKDGWTSLGDKQCLRQCLGARLSRLMRDIVIRTFPSKPRSGMATRTEGNSC